ncbi:uncharacterized protein LOC112084471 [Eutrema salsugineum]|uniref:uncharacterized protein LOC112084471 n=1 Tax=Eutrema salsugineum TaxID=72664 RepID=UPI000CED038F|nr:uncharacterized protein LOC112084471 [Eutrema salsugineum]
MKDMVSTCRTSREQPNWIGDTLWEEMTKVWDTEDCRERSATTSAARMSERGGLGPHVHVSGPKSYLQIQQEMEEELGRPVSLGEVFIKTHTRADGTYVDRKAQKVAEAYKKNLEAKFAELWEENLGASDGTTDATHPELSIEEDNELFLKSTFTNERGVHYGVGSLSQSRKRKNLGSTSTFNTVQEQFSPAQRLIEEQAAENARCEAELTKVSAAQQAKIDQLTLLERYLRETYPRFLDFMAANSAPTSSATTAAPVTDPTAAATGGALNTTPTGAATAAGPTNQPNDPHQGSLSTSF